MKHRAYSVPPQQYKTSQTLVVWLCYNTYCPLPFKPLTTPFEFAQRTSAKAIRRYKTTSVQYMYRGRSQVLYTSVRRPVHLNIVIVFLASLRSTTLPFQKESAPRQLPYVIARGGAQTGNALYRVSVVFIVILVHIHSCLIPN